MMTPLVPGTGAWAPLDDGSVGEDLRDHPDLLHQLGAAQIPAIVMRQAYGREDCRQLMARFVERKLIRDPKALAENDERTRIDVGTSLGTKGDDRGSFFAHAAETHALFANLFDGIIDPVRLLYDQLQALAGDKRVLNAREPDGRLYGPAIFRVHYDGHTYRPHIDHVTLREKRFDYAVTRFDHQFAGVLCVQNASETGESTQGLLHRCLWTEELQPHIAEGTFYDVVQAHDIEHCRVELEPGDLYFFNTRLIHEVPAVSGSDPRAVLAVFIGYSDDDDEIYVWS
ncbi:MAG: hypothetical protein VX733_08285 [Candidatus Latescibacterota bacterium]|nr:hypothetical protein [Candidatus Latescibacterota bacterium]